MEIGQSRSQADVKGGQRELSSVPSEERLLWRLKAEDRNWLISRIFD